MKKSFIIIILFFLVQIFVTTCSIKLSAETKIYNPGSSRPTYELYCYNESGKHTVTVFPIDVEPTMWDQVDIYNEAVKVFGKPDEKLTFKSKESDLYNIVRHHGAATLVVEGTIFLAQYYEFDQMIRLFRFRRQ